MALFRSLKHRSFLFLWLGQTISRVGDFMYEIALAWWVLQKTGDATLMGAVLILRSRRQSFSISSAAWQWIVYRASV